MLENPSRVYRKSSQKETGSQLGRVSAENQRQRNESVEGNPTEGEGINIAEVRDMQSLGISEDVVMK
jgi:hypothetical protein